MSVQKFARNDANVLTKAACDSEHGGMFCAKANRSEVYGWCGDYECSYNHDLTLQRRFREIALRLASRGYGPTKKQREKVNAPR